MNSRLRPDVLYSSKTTNVQTKSRDRLHQLSWPYSFNPSVMSRLVLFNRISGTSHYSTLVLMTGYFERRNRIKSYISFYWLNLAYNLILIPLSFLGQEILWSIFRFSELTRLNPNVKENCSNKLTLEKVDDNH